MHINLTKEEVILWATGPDQTWSILFARYEELDGSIGIFGGELLCGNGKYTLPPAWSEWLWIYWSCERNSNYSHLPGISFTMKRV